MKRMMKILVLVLVHFCVCVSADNFHEDLSILGCSDSDGEDMYSLDREELWFADFKNNRGVEPQPDFIDHITFVEGTYERAVAAQQICRQNLKTIRDYLRNPAVKLDPPSSPIVYSRDVVELDQENHLICHVSGFYPAPVTFSWTRNGENVTTGTSTNVPFPDKDGSFSQFSRLVFVPQLGDVYSCSVTHLALEEPLRRLWDVQVDQSGVGPAVFCGLGLTVGLLGVAVGTFFLIKGNECS